MKTETKPRGNRVSNSDNSRRGQLVLDLDGGFPIHFPVPPLEGKGRRPSQAANIRFAISLSVSLLDAVRVRLDPLFHSFKDAIINISQIASNIFSVIPRNLFVSWVKYSFCATIWFFFLPCRWICDRGFFCSPSGVCVCS